MGYTSAESNVITIDDSGITGVLADKPVAFIPGEDGVLVKCSEKVPNVNVYSMTGSLIQHYDSLDNDSFIYLPQGVYVITNGTARHATKLVVR